MSNRTVTANLVAKVAEYIAPVKEATSTTRGLKDEIHDTGAESKAEFDKMERSAVELTVAVKETGKEVDKTGTQMKETAADAHFLADELAKTRREAEALAAVLLAGGGDATTLAEYQKKTRYASSLQRTAKATGLDASSVVTDASKLGQDAGGAFKSGFAKTGSIWETAGSVLLNPAALPFTIAAAALIGAEVGGALGGGILVGLGAIGIGAGVAAAFQSPQVKLAVAGLGNSLQGIVKDVGTEFTGPTVEAVHIFHAEIDRLRPTLTATAHELAPITVDLARGWSQGLDIFAKKLETALVKSKPLLEWLADEGPKLGDQFGSLLVTIADHADEAEFALNALFGIVKIGIGSLEVLTKVGSAVLDPIMGLAHIAENAVGAGDKVGKLTYATGYLDDSVNQLSPDLNTLASSLKKTEVTADSLAGQMTDKVFSALMDADQATLSLAESHTRLADSLKQNKKNFDLTTAAGQANTEAVYSAIQANVQMYDTMIASGVGAKDAATAYDANTTALEKQLQKAHVAQSTIDQLIGKYRQVPDKVNTDIAVNGLSDAILELDDLIRKLLHLPPRVTTTIETIHVDKRKATYERMGGVEYAADGLVSLGQAQVYGGGTLYGFAEPQTGGEAFVPRHGDPGRSASILSEAASWYGLAVGRPFAGGMGGGGGSITRTASGNLTITLTGGDAATRAQLAGLRAHIQGSYGGNVQLALGQ